METVPFSLASQLIGVPRNLEELSFNMTPNFHLTPVQQDQRDGNELHEIINRQQFRRALEASQREERQRLQRQQEEDEIEAYREEMEEAIR
jgi:hypothetical protein